MAEQEEICRVIDCIGFYCPEPVFQTLQELETVPPGGIVEVLADDPAAEKDLVLFAKRSGHRVVKLGHEEEHIRIQIRKGDPDDGTDT